MPDCPEICAGQVTVARRMRMKVFRRERKKVAQGGAQRNPGFAPKRTPVPEGRKKQAHFHVLWVEHIPSMAAVAICFCPNRR
jgi:hypothetical protein